MDRSSLERLPAPIQVLHQPCSFASRLGIVVTRSIAARVCLASSTMPAAPHSMDPIITEVGSTSTGDSVQGSDGWDHLAPASYASPRSDGSQAASVQAANLQAAKVHAGPSSSSGPSVQTVQAAAKQAPGPAEGPMIQLVEPAPAQTGPMVAAAASPAAGPGSSPADPGSSPAGPGSGSSPAGPGSSSSPTGPGSSSV